MKKNIILLFLFFASIGFSQSFPVNSIAEVLLENVNSVLRLEDTHAVLNDQDKMTVKHRRVVTVFNKYGNHATNTILYYRNDLKVKSIKATVYDAKCNEIKVYKKKNFKDLSAVEGSTLYSDVRYYSLNHVPTGYPYTMDFEYEVIYQSTAFIPDWNPFTFSNQSIEKSVLTVVKEKDLGLKYKAFNLEDYPNVKVEQDETSLRFSAENLPAYRYEYDQPLKEDFLPFAYLTLESFSLHGVKGEVKNWSDFGSWMYANLIKDKDQVSEKTQQEVLDLVEGIEDPIERAKKVYRYVQDNMRYINVVIGIGGWEPIDAMDVDRVKYGDCKGLTNYTHALLKLVGVESYWTVLWSQDEKKDLFEDFASIQGNHMILTIPQENGEDIWLECTSSYLPFGYVPPSNDDRNVLVIKEDGGVLKRSPKFKDEDNLQVNTSLVRLDADGNMEASIQRKSTGSQYDTYYSLEFSPYDEVKKRYLRMWSEVPKLYLKNIDLTNDPKEIAFYENVELSSTGFAKKMGDRFMFPINPFNASVSPTVKYKTRRNPFQINRGYQDIDTYVIQLPEDYSVEALPPEVNLITDFGSYALSFEVEDAKLIVHRKFLLNSGKFPKDRYEDFRQFKLEISKLDNAKAVVSKSKT